MSSITDLVYIDATGYHYKDYPSFLAWLKEQYQGIYGADVYLEADSQDGQFLAILAQDFYDTAALGASTYNSFSPLSAQGAGLSRIVKINGIKRNKPTFSTVDVDVGGTVGTVIVNGVAQDTLDQKWNLPNPVLIPDAGVITVTATAQAVGAIHAQPNTINKIFTPTRGWQTINNSGAATPGAPIEIDAALRIRQSQSTANPSLTVVEGTYGAIANLEGVTFVKVYENDTGSTDINGINPHSICAVVEGGVTIDIAQTIALHKTPGTGTFGDTSTLVFDSHEMPLTIKFQRPSTPSIKVDLVIAVNDAYSSDYADLIKQALADYINGLGIGGNNGEVLITRLFAPAYLNGTFPGQSYDVVTLQIGKNSDPLGDINIPINFDEIPTCDPNTDITVTPT